MLQQNEIFFKLMKKSGVKCGKSHSIPLVIHYMSMYSIKVPLCAVLQHQQNHNYHTNYRYYVLQVFHV